MAENGQNPLLTAWLKEKWEVAQERGSKGALVYKKAYQSMHKCPLKFKHPSEAQNLQGIGPKLVDWLTEKLRAHCEENGLPMPTKGRKDGKRRSELAAIGQPEEEPSPERPAKKRKTKEYVPALRSGPYGIIKALSQLSDNAAAQRGLSKSDLQREAQPYSDSSYTVPSEAGKFYTAWKSMDTLLNKELVCTVGKPVTRYLLTEEGWEVAKKIETAEAGEIPPPAKKARNLPANVARRQTSINDGIVISNTRAEFPDAIAPVYQNRFTALAMSVVQDAAAPNRKNRSTAAPSGPAQLSNASKNKSAPPGPTQVESHDIMIGPPDRSSKFKAVEITDLTSSPEASPARPRAPDVPPMVPKLGSENTVGLHSGSCMSRASSTTASLPQTNDSHIPIFEPIILPAGSFEVRLVLDNREVRTQADRDYISLELKKHGITPIIRPLELGDALWVAEIKTPYDEGFLAANPDDDGEGKKEIVLDFIMERKRLDDLISSIKDGRFHEQKFRLRKSGVKNVVYCIEEFSISVEREDKYREAVESTLASMQVVNGFFVKQTGKLDETVTYLANLTEGLKSTYEQRDLRIIPSRNLNSQKYASMMALLRDRDPKTDHYITFAAFNLMCTKSDSLTLRDVYLKMLMCIKGVTGEKAMEIQRKWPTPKALIDAYDSASGAKAKESLISDELGGLIPRKKVAKSLSAKIAEVWA